MLFHISVSSRLTTLPLPISLNHSTFIVLFLSLNNLLLSLFSFSIPLSYSFPMLPHRLTSPHLCLKLSLTTVLLPFAYYMIKIFLGSFSAPSHQPSSLPSEPSSLRPVSAVNASSTISPPLSGSNAGMVLLPLLHQLFRFARNTIHCSFFLRLS